MPLFRQRNRTITSISAILAGAFWLQVTPCAHAQGGFRRNQNEIIFQNARVYTMAGRNSEPLEGVSVVVVGGAIRQISKDVTPGENATVIDASGMTITPGLIDVDGALGMTGTFGRPGVGPAGGGGGRFGGRGRGGGGGGEVPGSLAGGDAINRAWDAFDRYDLTDFKDAVRNGVTAVFISPGGTGIAGIGSVVRLEPGDGAWAGKVALEDAALCVDLGSGDRPTVRLGTFDRVRKALRGALDHREAQETYKEELEEYEKKVKERAEKEAKATPAAPGGEKKEEPKKEEKKEGGKPAEPKPGGGAVESESVAESAVEETAANAAPASGEPLQPDPRPRRGPRGGGAPGGGGGPPGTGGGSGSAPSGGGEGEAKDELKKPTEPGRDLRSDLLLKALDREIPVRVRAQRSEDILNAIDLAKEFNLRLVIDGGTESYLVGSQLKKAEVPVVLGPAIGRDVFVSDEFTRRDAGAAGRLSSAGVKWVVGSGGRGAASRFVLMNAQATVGNGANRDALRLVTADAADFLGVSDKCGRLRQGMPADLVLWKGDPLDPASSVAKVYVGGELVYQDEAGTKSDGEGGKK